MSSLGIRARLFGGFGAVLVLLTIVGWIGYTNTTQFAASFRQLYDERLVPVTELDAVKGGLFDLRVGYLAYGAANAAERAQLRADDATTLQRVDASLTTVADRPLLEEERLALTAWQQAYPAWLQTRQAILAAFDRGD